MQNNLRIKEDLENLLSASIDFIEARKKYQCLQTHQNECEMKVAERIYLARYEFVIKTYSGKETKTEAEIALLKCAHFIQHRLYTI